MAMILQSTIFPASRLQYLSLTATHRRYAPISSSLLPNKVPNPFIVSSSSCFSTFAFMAHDHNLCPPMHIFGRGRLTSVSISPLDFSVREIVSLAHRNSISVSSGTVVFWLASAQDTLASEETRISINEVFQIGELFELGIQLTYLLLLLALLGVGSFYVIRQVLVRRELDLSAKELQEQVRSGDASATELFELGAVMLRRKLYPVATKYLLQAIEKWDGDDQDLAQVYNALGVSYVRDEKIEKGIAQFEKAVKLQPGYVTAWNNLGDAYEKKNDFKSALKAFEEALLFDPNNKLARPRQEALKNKVKVYKGVAVKSKKS